MPNDIIREHYYHAEASILTGHLKLPLEQEIKPQAFVKLSESGGYLSQHLDNYRLEGVISFRSAYTQVAGNRDVKLGHGWSTLTTSVVEELNVLDVLTADRVVAQLSAEHPILGYVPSITFLGTRFENLRIAGHPVKLDLDHNMLGPKPEKDAPYSSDPGFVKRVVGQQERIRRHQDLPAEILERYNQTPTGAHNQESIECSLINQAEGSYNGRTFGHVIDVPNFGKIYLATLRLKQSDFHPQTGTPMKTEIGLTMIELKLGCVAAGAMSITPQITNGHTKP